MLCAPVWLLVDKNRKSSLDVYAIPVFLGIGNYAVYIT